MDTTKTVDVWEETVTIPTYRAGQPEKYPLFIEKRAYQGSTGKIYPLPVTEKISDEKTDVEYRAVSTFPIATGEYYKWDYSAGLLHVADHHIAPGKKQWTWGSGDFDRMWDRNLTEEDGPYIELMTGVYADNQPDELEEVDTEGSTVLEHREYAESVQASRDNIKIQKKSTGLGVRLVMLGLDHQEHIHYAMPLRVMGYDYATYKKQYDSNARKYADAKGLTEDEYLSRMRQSDKFVPVITVIVYYGEKPWNGAKSLHEMLH